MNWSHHLCRHPRRGAEIDAERGRQDLKRERLPKSPDKTTNPAPSSVVAQELTKALYQVRSEIGRETNVSAAISAALQRATVSAREVARRATQRDALRREIDLLRVPASMGLAIG